MDANEAPIRVLVADDEPLVRGGITLLLSAAPHIDVIAEASDGSRCVQLARQLKPDVVLMDLRMPATNGIEATHDLIASSSNEDEAIKVLVLTTFNDDDSLFGALRAGASGFLLKDNAPRHLLPAVAAVASGEHWIDPSVAGQVLHALRALPMTSTISETRTSSLTPREREILTLMARGMTNSEISKHFVLSEATVRTHVSRILMKTGCHDRAQAVVVAYQSGLTAPSR